jgi:hypothetical protein
MRGDLAQQLRTTVETTSLTVGADRWKLYVFGVVRVGRELFIQIALLGPRACTVTVRARAPIVPGVTVPQVLDVVGAWLLTGDASDHAYLELSGLAGRVS